MSAKAAYHAYAQLSIDSDAVNSAIQRLLKRAIDNGFPASELLALLDRKFGVILNGLAEVVLREHRNDTDDNEIVFHVPSRN